MHPNIQAIARKALAGALDAKVGVTVPNPRPAQFVLVRREGGALKADGHLDAAGIGVECWAATEQEAYGLAEAARAAMYALPYGEGVSHVAEEAFYSDPDPEDGAPRWYGSYTVTTHETFE